ncbi:MAG: uS9 family ribosomal protein, partial [Patescibacteria group bacterium]|nr:uS9 family ribosomal protein [Patescibacteria group bacterium]
MAVKTKKKYIEARGGRKTSSARVRIYEGKGVSIINDKPVDEYYPDKIRQQELLRPLISAGLKTKIHFSVLVRGGGRLSGQLGAIRLGLARAIVK